MGTYSTKQKDIKRDWHLVDAKGEILGRLSTKIAKLLMGKQKPYFSRNLDCGDYVVVINSAKIAVTGKKEKQKLYIKHSGYPGGLKVTPLEKMRVEHPERIIIHAVSGMLPQNKLKDKMLRRLYVFAQEEHPFKDKFKVKNEK
ncbi:MAG: 50S ribosomal protein L13 [Patescibacteria group bacterium]